jgi:hypothetical protein
VIIFIKRNTRKLFGAYQKERNRGLDIQILAEKEVETKKEEREREIRRSEKERAVRNGKEAKHVGIAHPGVFPEHGHAPKVGAFNSAAEAGACDK